MELVITVGASGSGKTTYAKTLSKTHCRVNRDSIRETVFQLDESHSNYYDRDVRIKEDIVTRIHHQTLYSLLKNGFNVVCDDTNLSMKYIKNLVAGLPEGNTIRLVVFMIDPLVCIGRDNGRNRTVGGEIIKKQKERLDNLVNSKNFLKFVESSNLELEIINQ